MRNFPVFATQWGVGSLVLQQIPYTGSAYITIQDTTNAERFLQDCVEFCKIAGAQHIYATGVQWLERYTPFAVIREMRLRNPVLDDAGAVAQQISNQSVEQWRQQYNEKMREIAGVSYLSIKDAERAFAAGQCYYAYKDGRRIGMGLLSSGRIDALASFVPGAGKDVLSALCRTIGTQEITLQVEQSNQKAIRLYLDFGFAFTKNEKIWYKII